MKAFQLIFLNSFNDLNVYIKRRINTRYNPGISSITQRECIPKGDKSNQYIKT